MKTAVSIPNHIFSRADALAGKLEVSRSALYTRALAEYLAKYDDRGVTEQLDAVHGTRPRRLSPEQRLALRDTLNRTEFGEAPND